MFSITSCIPKNKLVYLAGEETTTAYKVTHSTKKTERIIKPRDYLNIQVYSIDERVNNIFENSSSGALGNYAVNDSGQIVFPFVGKIKVAGNNLDEAQLIIQTSLDKYVANTSIIVRFVGNKITLIGEVRNPGEYTFDEENISIFQAISHANGVSQFGDKTKVKILRETNDKVEIVHVDLTKSSVIVSENYYVKQNDIIIVDPIRARFRAYRDYTVVYLLLTTVSTIAALSSIRFQ